MVMLQSHHIQSVSTDNPSKSKSQATFANSNSWHSLLTHSLHAAYNTQTNKQTKHASTYISRIRHRTPRLIRLDGTEGIILCRSILLREEVEQRGFAHVGQTHASHLEILTYTPEGDDVGRDVVGCFLWRHREVG
jgi:hypothetical protein